MKLKKINLIFLLFFSLIAGIVLTGWRFINSSSFSQDLSTKVSELILNKLGANSSFEKVDFVAFPPRTVIRNLKFQILIPEKLNLDLKAEEVAIDFSLTNIFSKKLELSSLEIRNAKIKFQDLDTKPSAINWKQVELSEIFEKYKTIAFSEAPVALERLSVRNSNFEINNTVKFKIDSLSSALNKKSVRVKGKFTDVFFPEGNQKTESIDSFYTNIFWSKESINVLELNVDKEKNKASGHFEITNSATRILHVEGTLGASLNLPFISGKLNMLEKEIGPIEGTLDTDIILNGRVDNPIKKLSFEGKDLRSKWIDLDLLKGEVSTKGSAIHFDQFYGKKDAQEYRLLKSFPAFDLKKLWFIEGPFLIDVNNGFSRNFLQAVPDLDTLEAIVSGAIKVEYKNRAVSFNINNGTVKEMRLVAGTERSAILQNQNYRLNNFSVTLDSELAVKIVGDISDGMNILKVDGYIRHDGIDIDILPKSKINLTKFGSISGVKLEGAGDVSGKISGKFSDVIFALNADWKNFSVVEINFGDVVGSFSFHLKDLSLDIEKLKGNYLGNIYSGNGVLYFGENSGLDVGIDIEKATYLNLLKMLPLIFKNISLPNFVDFAFESGIKIKGPFETSGMEVSGKVKGREGRVFEEEIDAIDFKFNLKKNILEFDDVILKKFKANMQAYASVNLASGFVDFKGKTEGLYLNDFKFYRDLFLGYQGKVDLDFEGNGTKDNLSSRYKLKVSEASIANVSMPGTNVIAFFNGKELTLNGNVLGNKIKFDSVLNLENKLSSLKAKIDTNDIKDILGIISSHNLVTAKISGKLRSNLDILFDLKNFRLNKLNLNILDFNLRKDQFSISNDPKFSQIIIEEGNISKWGLRFVGDNGAALESRGVALGNNSFRIENSFNVDAGLVELLTPYIERSAGKIMGNYVVFLGEGVDVRDFNIKGEGLYIKVKDLKSAFNNISFEGKKSGKEYLLTKLKADFGDGDISADGKLEFLGLFPKIFVNYQISKTTLPLFKKTSVVFSSSGEITGDHFPYFLKGKVNILHGESFDDPSDFLEDKKINLSIYDPYLPKEKGSAITEYLLLNLQFDLANPFLIKNNLAEIYIKGNGSVNGSPKSPDLNLKLEAVPNLSKFKFKGNDFNLTQGYVEIHDVGKIRQSDIHFTGLTKLNDYDLKLEITGKVDKVNINISSDPPLSHDDLLSLLTLGVTNDMSKNLDSSDRKFVTTVGLGTLLVDQFKINEDLNSALGLKLSVLPEFKENETQLIQGKSAVSESSSSKLKSSTKVKLDKKISSKVDLSVSSTFGGSIEQKQEMNLNFNINRNWSVEGVYELKNSDTEEGNSTNSVGADVKYKWSF